VRGAGLDGSGGRCERRSVCSGLVFSGLRGTRGGRRTEKDRGADGSKKRTGTHLIPPRRLLRQRHDGGHAHGEVIAADVIDAGLLHGIPDGRGAQVVELVLVGGGQVGAHAAVVAGDDDAAAAGGLGVVDAVFGAQAGVAAGGR